MNRGEMNRADPTSSSPEPALTSAAPVGAAPPQARLRRRRWGFSVVWVVPIIAALVSGALLIDQVRELGPMITLRFEDGSGLKAGQTDIQYRGVQVGLVKAVELSPDLRHVEVRARLHRSAAALAREGSLFWIVRLKGGLENLASLGTVISGAYIEVRPGTGETRREFAGLDRAPVTSGNGGLRILLRARHNSSIWPNTPIYYRGIEVGAVQEGRLGADASEVVYQVFIEPRYAKLVTPGSRFWNVSGVKVDFGLFRGLKVDVESLRSLATGGIAFATPANAPPARDGAVFQLHKRPHPAWLAWTPRIPLGADDTR